MRSLFLGLTMKEKRQKLQDLKSKLTQLHKLESLSSLMKQIFADQRSLLNQIIEL